MTNEEAIKMLKQWNEDLSPYEDEKEGIECHNIAISALEKQIPKKVLVIEMPCENIYYCPNCHNAIPNGKYCSKCGQALDFNSNGSDTE